jgi:F-type H+-transporting ATPase subunit b
MEETLRQLGELLLGAVPTVILLALLYALYTSIVHKPLQRVLDERRSKTEGAVEKSRADIAAAEARTTEYEQKLREARATVFRAQETKPQAALHARAAALHQAREPAQAQVQAAKTDIEKDRAAAEKGLHGEAQIGDRRSCGVCSAGRSGTMTLSSGFRLARFGIRNK